MYQKHKNCLDSCFLRLIFPHRGLLLLLIQQSLFRNLLNVQRVSLRCLSYSKRRKINQNDPSLSPVVIRCHSLSLVAIFCQSLSFVVTVCLSLYQSLSLFVPFVVSSYHLLSFVVTRCTGYDQKLKTSMKLINSFIMYISFLSIFNLNS